MVVLIRLILGAVLCIGVYSETGKWTTIFSVLVLINTELTSYLKSGHSRKENGSK